MAKKSKADKVKDDLRESAHRVWLAGLGALSAVEEEGGKWFQKLVDKGKVMEKEGRAQATKAKSRLEEELEKAKTRVGDAVEDVGSTVEEKLTEALHRFGVPTRDEIRDLTKRVEELNAKIDRMKGGAAKPAATKPAAAKAAAPRAAAKKAAPPSKPVAVAPVAVAPKPPVSV